MSGQPTRRGFLQAGAAAGIGFFVAGATADDAKKERSPNERLKFACIGVGGKGSSDTNHVGELGDIVALCDIDDNFLAAKAKSFPKAQKFNDFRELLRKLDKQIDAVTISTPDHTHAVAAAMAIKMGKHVYVQKPLTHSVSEARALRKLAREHKVCSQLGNQGTALDQFRTSVELVHSGVLGATKEVHLWTNRPVWPQSPKVTSRPPAMDPPKHVHWDLFIGPAPMRPYAEYEIEEKKGRRSRRGAYHDFNWRGWWDFGTGALGDMACHTANMPYMALKLGAPVAISGESEKLNDETYPGWARVTYEFKVAGRKEPLKVMWYEGSKDGKRVLPSLELIPGKKNYSGSGSLMVFEKAAVYSPDDYGATRELIGKDTGDLKPPSEKKFARIQGKNHDLAQKQEWVASIKKGDPKANLGNFDYSAALTEFVLLGNCAIRAGKRLEYDAENMKFTNDSAADKLLSREYRQGWKL